jgi:hypothetical protein
MALAGLSVVVLAFGAFVVVQMSSDGDPAANFEDQDGNLVAITELEAKELYSVNEIKQFANDNPVPVPVVGAYWGIYSDPKVNNDYTLEGRQKQISEREALVGRSFNIDRQFYTWGKSVPSAYDKWTVEQGRIPHISIKAPKTGSGSWRSVADGDHDSYIREVAQGLKALDVPLFFTFHHEPDNNVGDFGSAADYVAAWRHIHDIFNQENAENVAMTTVSIPWTYSSKPDLAKNLYPGDDVIDWISTDPYNFFTRDGVWRDLEPAFKVWYDYNVENHPSKPLMFAEWGTNVDPNNYSRVAQWFADVEDDLKGKYPAIKAVTYYDELRTSEGNDWRIDQTQASLNAFKAMGKDIYFSAPLFAYEDGGQDPLTAPSGLSLQSQDSSLRATWTASSPSQNVSNYAIRYRPVGSTTWEYGSWVPDNSYEITGLNNGTAYEVQVRAVVNSSTKSTFSTSAIGTPAVPPPPGALVPPSGLTLSSEDNSLIANWEAVNYDNFKIYAVRYKVSGTSSYSWGRTSDTSYRVDGLSYGTSYDFEVRTVLDDGKSAWSAPVSLLLTEPLDTIAPDVPSNLEVQKCGSQCFRATWDANTEDDFASYTLRYRAEGGEWVTLNRTTDEGEIVGRLSRSQRYEVQIRATDELENNSNFSNSVFIQL